MVEKSVGGKLGEYPFIDHNGFLWVNSRITRLGVMQYETPDKPGHIHKELKNEKELFNKETMESFYGVPVTVEHPMEGEVKPQTCKLLSVGTSMQIPTIDEAHYLRCKLLITEDEVIKDILSRQQNGQNLEVSCGYYADLDWTPGVWNSIEYDAVQRNIRFNHIALVSEGRAGPEVKLLI